MTFIWATRGRSWGFRFLRTGGYADPLPVYEAVFGDLDLSPQGCQVVGDKTALRLADPEGRTDRSGRPIMHDFVLLAATARTVHSVEDGLRVVWPQVRDEYATLWGSASPTA